MRTYYAIGIAILLMVGLGVKVFFFSSSVTDAQRELQTRAGIGIDIFQMHLDFPKMKTIPVQDIEDPI
jgi:hypothetical protein